MNRSLEPFTTPEETTLHGHLATQYMEEGKWKFQLKQQPLYGVADIYEQGAFSYTPNEGFWGTDQFIVQIIGVTESYLSTVIIDVTPVSDDSDFQETTVITTENTSIKGSLVKRNQAIPSYRFSIASSPRNGSVILSEDGSYTYTPTDRFCGKDSFTVFVTDDSKSMEEVKVIITITSHEHKLPISTQTATLEDTTIYRTPPVRNVSIVIPSEETIPIVQPSVKPFKAMNSRNPIHILSQKVVTEEGLSVRAKIRSRHKQGLRRYYQLLSPPANGMVSLQKSGIFFYDPNPGYVGSDVFTISISDRLGNTLVSPIIIEIKETEEE